MYYKLDCYDRLRPLQPANNKAPIFFFQGQQDQKTTTNNVIISYFLLKTVYNTLHFKQATKRYFGQLSSSGCEVKPRHSNKKTLIFRRQSTKLLYLISSSREVNWNRYIDGSL